MITIKLGPDADSACLQGMASSERDYFEAMQPDQLAEAMRHVHAEGVKLVAEPEELVIEDVVPENMRYERISPDDEWDPALRRLRWRTAHVGREGVTHTFRVWPEALGLWPTNVRAEGVFTDVSGHQGHFVFSVPEVIVVDLARTPTPSATPPPTPTATPTATAIRPGGRLFLPDLRR
jgi:hypothetical protein